MKNNSYDEWWLSRDMDNMAYIFEYSEKYCKKIYGVDIDQEKFINEFMRSNIRYEMETGHPMLLSESAQDSVEKFINVDNLGNIDKFKRRGKKQYYNDHQLYWIGWMYAYLHYEEDILSRDLIELLPLDVMLHDYYLGHEVSRENYHNRIKWVFSQDS